MTSYNLIILQDLQDLQSLYACYSHECGDPNKPTMKDYYVYIITNKRNGTLYTGVTSDLVGRIYQHKTKIADGFSKKYGLHMLVYYEQHLDIYEAITREKQIKKWYRNQKIYLIESFNPYWRDLYSDIIK